MNALAARRPPVGAPVADLPFTDDDFDVISRMLRADAGIDLPPGKASLVYARLSKRVRELQLATFADYCALLSAPDGDEERREMLCALTTNVTRFFRERHHFEHLEREALPALLAHARAGGRVRLWSAACSSGQEAYSIALSILAVDPSAARLDVKVLATDIDPRIVAQAREARYSVESLADVPAATRARRFVQTGDGLWQPDDDTRALVSFRMLNLNGDWPMRGGFDVIFCRNVAIYFDAATQLALWSRLARQMTAGGWLYIGHSERVAGEASQALASSGVTTYRLKGASRA